VFSAEWLALREPADAGARSAQITECVVGQLDPHRELRALDLACGTGANARYLAGRMLALEQNWLLADHDRALLAEADERMTAWGRARGALRFSFDTRDVDLRRLNDFALFDRRALVTASALLDLVSEAWLRALADRCRRHAAIALFALTYDGRMQCDPADDEDDAVRTLVNRHQQRDKGFGAALGPSAIDAGVRCFADCGFRVERSRSDWVLDVRHAELQRQLIQGWASAASEVDPARADAITAWRGRRLAHVEANRSHLVVGHEDFCALPSGRSTAS
jgi:hypothetical protein